ncbi:LOB domain-containing protein 24-like [Chenopodium quinoa]|uniref:LOB domain-containing protein 24-like n=1 Tax=Chenopodium quinoa TaxID=63459 RepID=UPI000B76FD1B|nr:LOB domain-containing protein 24-like [Chenopodium quinoa]
MSNSRRCAACKYLRRRCPKDCIFGPYFPSTNLERFASVHKIFGASNVAKMLKQLPEERRSEAAESMVLEARSRVRDPVYGSVGTITQLRQQIMEAEYELAKTQGLIALLSHAQNLHEQQQKFEAENKLPLISQNQDNLHFDHSLLLNDLNQQQQSKNYISWGFE